MHREIAEQPNATTRQSPSRAQNLTPFNDNAPTQFCHKMTGKITTRAKKDGLTAVESLTKKYARTYCTAYGGKKFLFKSKDEAVDFIQRYSTNMLATNGYAPKRSYWCPSCKGYHVTSQSLCVHTSKRSHAATTTIDTDLRQGQKSARRTLTRIDQLISRANKALAEHRLGDAHVLCVESVKLFERLSGHPGSNLRQARLMDKLNECVSKWAAEEARLQRKLFTVTYNPTKVMTKQWYMLDAAV